MEASLQALDQAARLEEEGQAFYSEAAAAVSSAEVRSTFLALANDERDHLDMVRRQREALTRGAGWLPSPGPLTPVDLDLPLFPKGKEAIRGAIRSLASDREALLFGLDIEDRSYGLYTRLARETADPRGRTMFQFLAAAERRHFQVLMMRLEAVLGHSLGWQG